MIIIIWKYESGGFTSLYYKTSGGNQNDDYTFIFALDNKDNYYIIKGKKAICFTDHCVSFGLLHWGGCSQLNNAHGTMLNYI